MVYNINLQDIADKLDFDLEDVEMLLEVFLESAQESMSSLEEAVKENNLEQIFKAAHAIKGSAANLTLNEISDLAKDMEHSAREEESAQYGSMFENLKKLIDNIQA